MPTASSGRCSRSRACAVVQRPPPRATGVGGRRDRLLHVGVPARLPRVGLGQPALHEQPERVPGRRLGEGPSQQHGGRLGRPARRRPRARLGEAVDSPLLARGLGGQQVLRDPLGGGARVVQEAGRRAVGPLPLGRRQLAVEPLADHRVDERERASRPEDADGGERVRPHRPPRPVDPRQRGRLTQVGRLEHGQRAGETRGGGGSRPRRTSVQRPTAEPPKRPTSAAAAAVGDHPPSAEPRHELAHQEGRPPVARWQASAKAGSGASPSSASSTSPTPAG